MSPTLELLKTWDEFRSTERPLRKRPAKREGDEPSEDETGEQRAPADAASESAEPTASSETTEERRTRPAASRSRPSGGWAATVIRTSASSGVAQHPSPAGASAAGRRHARPPLTHGPTEEEAAPPRAPETVADEPEPPRVPEPEAQESSPIPASETEDVRPSEQPAAAVREADQDFYDRSIDLLARLFEAVAVDSVVPGRTRKAMERVTEVARRLTRLELEDEGLLRRTIEPYPDDDSYLIPQSLNVAILALVTGRELNLDEESILTLALAALLHDIGAVRLPRGLLMKPKPLTEEEQAALRQLPTHGAEIVRELSPSHSAVAELIEQVYERVDGSGYPKGLEGDAIAVEARIIGAADFFEAYVHARPYRGSPARSPNQGVQALTELPSQFGNDVVKALVRSVGLFPIGTYVRLSSGEIARVVRVNRDNPMRPAVEVVEAKKERESRRLDLVDLPHVYVTKSLGMEELLESGLVDEQSPAASGVEPRE